MGIINKVGRRKQSIARVYMSKGSGKITVNGKDYKDYFPTLYMQQNLEQPVKIVEAGMSHDYKVNVSGGGFKGQIEAARLAIARALVELYPDTRENLKSKKLLTRDARIVERKKPGLRKARKKEQYSKR